MIEKVERKVETFSHLQTQPIKKASSLPSSQSFSKKDSAKQALEFMIAQKNKPKIVPMGTTHTKSPFQKMSSVEHKTFGAGIVHEVEIKGTVTIVTVRFHNHGLKKIDSKFLTLSS
jgi:hypothetical protein